MLQVSFHRNLNLPFVLTVMYRWLDGYQSAIWYPGYVIEVNVPNFCVNPGDMCNRKCMTQ